MGKKPCILGKNCPNQIAKRNFSFLLSDDDSEPNHNLKENCVFCGSYTIKRKKVSDTSSLWSSSSNEDKKMKRPITSEIDSLCGMRSSSKKKKEDNIGDNFDYLLKQVLKKAGTSSKKDDDEDEELSDSGVKLDFDSPSSSGAYVKKNNAINSFKMKSSVEPNQQNGFNQNIFKLSAQSNFNISNMGNSTVSSPDMANSTFSSPDVAKDKDSPLMSGTNSSANEFSPIRKKKNIFRIDSPVSEDSINDSPFKKEDVVEESDPFEFDSDHEMSKQVRPVSAPSKVTNVDNVNLQTKPNQSLWSKDKGSDDEDDEVVRRRNPALLKHKALDSDDDVSKDEIPSSPLFPKDKDLDSDIEDKKPAQSVTLFSRDKDFEEAGPSSRPDMLLGDDQPRPSTRQNARFMNLSYLPKHKVERLVYKAIKLQILNEFSSSSDEDDIWITKEVKKDRKRKRCKKSNPVRDKTFKSNQRIGSGFYRWKKRRRTHNFSDEDSNLTFESTNDASDVDDDSDNLDDYDDDNSDGIQVRACAQDHDYSTSEFHKIAEANIDSLAFETEKLNWDDTVMIDDATMDSAIITIDDTPQRFDLPLLEPAEGVITLDETDTSNTTKSKSPDKSPNLNNSDHIYCVTDIKLERPAGPSSALDQAPGTPDGSDKTEDYNVEDPIGPKPKDNNSNSGDSSDKKKIQWECPICMEPSNGQEIAGTVCGHIFCKDCIESYLVTCSQCPTCRKELSKNQLFILYDLMK